MGAQLRRLRQRARTIVLSPVVHVPPRFAMSEPGWLRGLLMQGLLRRFADRDPSRGAWPRCADGTRTHDLQGKPRCPACGFEPTLAGAR